MVVRHGHVVAEGWWAPYSAGRPHLLHSLTTSFSPVAVGLAIADGLLSLDDRVVDVLPGHVPAGISEQGRRLTVHHWTVADLYVITTPHRVRLVVDAGAGTAVATWSTVPLTGPGLALHLRAPLMTRPDVA
jgi:hypothetical protein